MKVSNNALNFLLAQYRAIFKHAYIKGLAPAVMLTAALAAGQAQAAAITDSSNADLSGTTAVTIDGSSTPLTISGATGGTTINWSNPNVTITSGATSANYIKGSGGAVTITGTGSLTINTSDASNGLGVTGHTNGVNIGLQSIDIQKGTLSIDASGSGASVTANTINIGVSGSTSTTRDATLQLSGTTASQTATLGGDGAVINVYANGQLKATTDSGSIAIKGDALNLGAGALFISDAGSNSGATITIESKKLKADAGSVHVIYDDGKAFTEEFKGQTATLHGNLLVGTSGTLVLEPETTAEGEGIGTVTLAKGSNTVITGELKVNAGTLVVDSGAALNASAETAKLTLASGSGKFGTLQISSDSLKSFLNGGAKYADITSAGVVSTTLDKSGTKALFNLSGGRIELTDTNDVDLATTFYFSGGSKAGLINVDTSSGGTIAGQNITISKTLADDESGTNKLTSGSKLNIEAENLTLGSSTLDQSTTKDLGFASAQARHLTVASQDGTFTLVNTVNLAATRSVEQNGQTIIEADSGTIKGNMLVSGTLSVQGGSYEAADALDISGGTLSVVNTAVDGQNVDTRLDVKGNLTLQTTVENSKISVDGNNADASTILDISDATLSFNSGTKTANVEAVDGGVLVLKGDQLERLLLTPDSGKSGSTVTLSGGTIQVIDDLALDASKIQTADADSKLVFSGTGVANTLIVEDELTLNNVSSLSLGGASGSIRAGILNLNGSDDNTAASLTSGSYTALRSLTTNGNKGITVGDTATLDLGAIDTETLDDDTIEYSAQGGGSITADVEVNHAQGAFSRLPRCRW